MKEREWRRLPCVEPFKRKIYRLSATTNNISCGFWVTSVDNPYEARCVL